MEATIPRSSELDRPIDKKLWTARVLKTLLVLFLLMDAAGKILRLAPYVEGTARVGYPVGAVLPLGLVLLAITILYVVPRTSVLGALLLTAHLGGATATHVRMGESFVMPVVFGVLVWVCVYLRDERVRALLPLVRPRDAADRS
jgi:hypothetical protein